MPAVRACVLGEVDLVRALGLGGVRSAVVAPAGRPVRYSRHVTERLEWSDPRRHADRLVETLVRHGAAQPERPVLYYDGDWDLLLVSRHRERLSEVFRFVVPDAELVEQLVDKVAFQALAARSGLPVPPATVLRAGAAAPALEFPLLVKPLTRDHATWRPLTAAKAIRVGDPAALARLAEQLAAADLDVMLQQEVPGPESRIASYHTYIDGEGSVRGEFTGAKVRTYPAGYGYTTALSITRDAEVTETGREICRRLGLRGVAKLDFKRDPEGRLHLLEVNPRFNLWHHPGALAGVNLPALVHADLTTGAHGPVPRVTPGARWCNLAHDWLAARGEGVSAGAWLRWVLSAEARSGFAVADPLPLAGAALWRVRHGAGRRRGGGARVPAT